MTAKEIIRVIFRTATFITIFIVLFSAISHLYDYVGIEATFGGIIFWFIVCCLTALKISLIKEDF